MLDVCSTSQATETFPISNRRDTLLHCLLPMPILISPFYQPIPLVLSTFPCLYLSRFVKIALALSMRGVDIPRFLRESWNLCHSLENLQVRTALGNLDQRVFQSRKLSEYKPNMVGFQSLHAGHVVQRSLFH